MRRSGRFLQKGERIAGFAAAKTFVETFLGVDRERRRLFLVKRAQGFAAPAFLADFHTVVAKKSDQVDGGFEILDLLAWRCHSWSISWQSSFSSLRWKSMKYA